MTNQHALILSPSNILFDWLLVGITFLLLNGLIWWAVTQENHIQGPLLVPGTIDIKISVPGKYSIYRETIIDWPTKKTDRKVSIGNKNISELINCEISELPDDKKVANVKSTSNGMPYCIDSGIAGKRRWGIPVKEFSIWHSGMYRITAKSIEFLKEPINLTIGPRYVLITATLIGIIISASVLVFLGKRISIRKKIKARSIV